MSRLTLMGAGMAASASVSFLPTDLSGTVAWLRADDDTKFTLVSDKVSQWNDESAQGGNHATQSTDAKRPTRNDDSTTGLKKVTFDGSDDWLRIADHSSLDPAQITVFVACAPTAWQAYSSLINKDTGSWTTGWRIRVNAGATTAYTNINSTVASLGTPDTTGRRLYTLVYDQVNLKARRNSSETASTAHTTAITANSTGVHICTTDTTSGYVTVDLFEIVVYSRALGSSEISQVETYLTSKWVLA